MKTILLYLFSTALATLEENLTEYFACLPINRVFNITQYA